MRKSFLLIASVILFSCSNKDKVKLVGKIDNSQAESKIFLYEQQVTGSNLLDSAKLSSLGEFKFKVKTTEPKFYLLQIGSAGTISLLLSPGESPCVTADASNLTSSVSVSGSAGTKLVIELNQKHDSVMKHLDSIVSVYKRIKDEPSSKDQIVLLNNDFINSKIDERKNIIKFILENYKSLASIMALYLKYDSSNSVLQYPRDLQYYKIVSDTLTKMYPASKQVKALKTDFDKMLKMQKSMVLQSMIKNAKNSIPEIALPNMKGDTIRITSLRGKIIILSFWSSESKACLMINRDFLYLYKKYNKSGLVIYQVSVESDKNKWLNAIKEIPWISVAEINKENSYYAKVYNITQVPASFLIDQKGNFKGKNLNVRELDRAISGLLKK